MNVNKAILVGRLTRDPEVRSTQSGQSVCSISLATNNTWTDKSGQKQESTEFHNLVLWGRLAEIAGQYLIKGQEAFFEGRLTTRSYTDKSNIERRTTEIVVENMQLGSKPQGGSSAGNYGNTSPAKKAPNESNKNKAAEEEIPTINLDDKDEINIDEVPF